jgi:putative nucleotidyltransferase with HDIG domain
VLLTPIGLLAAIVAKDDSFAFLLVLPLATLLRVFARERSARIDQAIELSAAYRGTAFLLGEVIVADDEYTGEHSYGVIALSLEIADELGLNEDDRRLVEFGALLHDVGKIAVPKAIVNKPGPLDDEEWKVMRQHTVTGQRMLDKVGGSMTEVGVIVRASHERWDGNGYPDGIGGEEVPLPARIVSVADTFHAITTTRPYRTAQSAEAAVKECARARERSSIQRSSRRSCACSNVPPRARLPSSSSASRIPSRRTCASSATRSTPWSPTRSPTPDATKRSKRS